MKTWNGDRISVVSSARRAPSALTPTISSKPYLNAFESCGRYACSYMCTHSRCLKRLAHYANQASKILSVENLLNNLVQKSLPLTYTPRQFAKQPDEPYPYTTVYENNTLAPELRAQLLPADPNGANGYAKVLPPEHFGYPRESGR